MKTQWTVALMASALVLPFANAQETASPKKELSLPLLNGDAWAFSIDMENEIATHRFTGMVCPFVIPGEYDLVAIAQLGSHGAPARCTYKHASNGGFTSISANWIYKAETAKTMALRTLSVSEGGKNFQPDDLETKAYQTNFDGVSVSDCHRLRLPYISGETPAHEKIAACQIGKWNFQINQTAPISDQSFEEILNWSKISQSDMADNLDTCASPVTAPAPEDDLSSDETVKKALAGEVLLRTTTGGLQLNPLSPRTCFLAYVSTDQAELLIMRDKDSDFMPLSIYEANLKGLKSRPVFWTALTLPFSEESNPPNTYALFSQVQNGTHHMHKLYEGSAPSDQQFIEDVIGVMNNKLPSRGYLLQGENGKWSWALPPTE